MVSYYIGVDVGTTSVRAGVVTSDGHLVHHSSRPIEIWNYDDDYFEQSSEDIWKNMCEVVKEATASISNKADIHGIGFDATCSLVALDDSGEPVSVSKSGDRQRNVIMWLDHRAIKQAEIINGMNHEVLKYVGGVLSPEMQAPKLLWLKDNLPSACWDRTSLFLDLPEYLTYKATDDPMRSMCSIVCKFNYLGHQSQKQTGTDSGWIDSYWNQIGLKDLTINKYSKLGSDTSDPGQPIGKGLTKTAAEQMGLWEGCPVGCSLIDAHAGGIGVIGADVKGSALPCENQPITTRLVLVCGTSTCHMAISEEPIFVRGVWGPYYSSMVPGLWLNEGGQSATGKLLDHLVQSHPAYKDLKELATNKGKSTYEELNDFVKQLSDQQSLTNPALLARDFHMLPDFHGNRSPIADPNMKGMICGLSLSCDLPNLAVLYMAALQALALWYVCSYCVSQHGTRHIIESMNTSGHHINTLFLCGGLVKNPLFVQMQADVTGMPCVLPRETESVLIGSAILGACAAGDFGSVQDAMRNMTSIGRIVHPNSHLKAFHNKKHQVFHEMLKNHSQYQQIMQKP